MRSGYYNMAQMLTYVLHILYGIEYIVSFFQPKTTLRTTVLHFTCFSAKNDDQCLEMIKIFAEQPKNLITNLFSRKTAMVGQLFVRRRNDLSKNQLNIFSAYTTVQKKKTLVILNWNMLFARTTQRFWV
jgi:hypothetical protein